MKVKFTPSARNQFLSAIKYIQKDKPSAAKNFRIKSETILRRLEKFSHSGRAIPEFPELPYREAVVPPYRFFYKVKEDIVWIAAVWHGAQLPKEPKSLTSTTSTR